MNRNLTRNKIVRPLVWSLVVVAVVVALVLRFVDYYLPLPIRVDPEGYKTLRIFVDASPHTVGYGEQFVHKLIDNVVQHSGEKIKVKYVDRNAHVAIFVTDASRSMQPISRLRYRFTHPFSKKIICQAVETTSFWRNTIVKNFNDYGLLCPGTSMVIGPQYSSNDTRYAYMTYYVMLLNDIMSGYPNVERTQGVFDHLTAIRTKNLANHPREKFCSFIFSYDDLFGMRSRCFIECSKIEKVSALGALFHNDDTLWNSNNGGRKSGDWHGAKMNCLKQYKFDICIENTNVAGYVTEKLVDGLVAGCIPIYAGSENRPHPKVFNQNAILFWYYDGDNAATVEKIKHLNADMKAYEQFIAQPIFMPTAAAYVTKILTDLHEHTWRLLQNALKEFDAKQYQ